MTTKRLLFAALLTSAALFAFSPGARADDAPRTNKVYGEWRIRIKPDKGKEYNELIRTNGLTLFQQAGGRMVGWWATLVGDLYEHVTIWEYDDMAAFEKAIGFLGPNEKFHAFVALRDPLLSGEESRFLRMPAWAEPVQLPDPSKFVIHETHRVPLKQIAEYLAFMEHTGLPTVKKHGFRPVGPFTIEIGNWTEVTYLFRFESIAERERLIAQFGATPDAQTYAKSLFPLIDENTTRLLLPAPFLSAPPAKLETSEVSSPLLPHLEQVAAGAFACGFSDRYQSANCGWVELEKECLLIDLPRGVEIREFAAEVKRISGKPIGKLALTSVQASDAPAVRELVENGVQQVIVTKAIGDRLTSGRTDIGVKEFTVANGRTMIGDASAPVEYFPRDGVAREAAAVVNLPQHQVLFAGPLVVNGPRSPLPGSNTEQWIAQLAELEKGESKTVVPGFGSWGTIKVVTRERQFLAELRRQVAYLVARGRPISDLEKEVRIPADYLVWMPYDTPTIEDLDHVYRELTVPYAPFGGDTPLASSDSPHALVLIGDLPHEPGHLEAGLAPVFAATGVVPHFTVDVKALTAENLAKVKLLVVLRDGVQRPTDNQKDDYMWMTPEQQQAVVDYVEKGGAFLNLHNSMGLYPDDGPYLHLVGGRYIGHGPLERFRVEVVDGNHPITRGITGFSVADEQHTPPYDAKKVHLLLQSRSDDGKSVAAAGWAYEPGRGRLCHLASGHTRDALNHPTYQQLMRNAVNWCLRRE